MMFRETIALASGVQIKHGNTFCAENVEFFNVKPIDACSNRWTFNSFDRHQFDSFYLLSFD
jgi:hypothetical protein